MPFYVVLAGIGVLAALLTGLWRRSFAAARMLDLPNPRSSHAHATPSGAGIAIIAAFLPLALGLYASGAVSGRLIASVAGGGLLVALMGLADDYRRVAPAWRLLVHCIAAAGAVALIGPLPELLPPDPGLALRWLVAIAMVLGLVWHVNLFNFMDGIDGIAGSQAIFVAVSGAVLSSVAGHGEINGVLLGLAAASFGFLVWNWPPAKVFMGDVGSGFLGYALAVLACYSAARSMLSVWTWFILMDAFIVDATVTLVRRLLSHEKVYQAHRSHAYQWCARRLGSHARVTMTFCAINIGWLLPLALTSVFHRERAFEIAIVATAPLVVLALWLGAGKREVA